MLSLYRHLLTSHRTSQALLKSALGSLGPKQRREFKDSPLEDIVDDLLPSVDSVVPILANLAVAVEARGQGLGKVLCEHVETTVKDWGYRECMLLVEEGNAPARGLYEKLGYMVGWRDDYGNAMRVEEGELKFTTVPTLAMGKLVV